MEFSVAANGPEAIADDNEWLSSRTEAPHLVAGAVVVVGNKIKGTAPVISYMGGWPVGKVKVYCEKKGWKLEIIS